jgi:outer membrane protein assembly factor BamB
MPKIFSKICLVLLSILLFNTSCHKEEDTILDSNGVAVKLPSLWNTSISDDGKLAQVIIQDAIVYDGNNALVGGNKNGDRSIISINGESGSKNWEWSDLLGLLKNPSYKDPFYIYQDSYELVNNQLLFTYSTSTYYLDLQKGVTNWKHKVELARDFPITSLGNVYYTTGKKYYYDTNEPMRIYRGLVKPEQIEQVYLTPNYTTYGDINSIKAFSYQGDTLLYVAFNEPLEGISKARGSDMALYNTTKNKWIYDKKELEEGAIHPIYKDNYVYYMGGSGTTIRCNDIFTGNDRWMARTGSIPLTSRLLLADGRIYAACEDRILYCIDANTGSIIWKEANTGTCSNLSYLNGILYYLGGGDGLLHAVDTATGKHLWKLKSPDLSTNSGAWFYGTCVAVPGKDGKKGTVIATTGIHAYGYEAIR